MKNLLYVANIKGPAGYASAARAQFNLLKKIPNINLKVLSVDIEGTSIPDPDILKQIEEYEIQRSELDKFVNDESIVFYHFEPGNFFQFVCSRLLGISDLGIYFKKAKKSFCSLAWEPDDIPQDWSNWFSEYFDGIVVPSFWNKSSVAKRTKVPIHVLPYVIKKQEISQTETEANGEFNILCCSQFNPRKGFDILVRSFFAEFYNEPKVNLIIKTYQDPKRNQDEDRQVVIQKLLEYKSQILGGVLRGEADFFPDHQEPKCKIKLIHGVIPRKELNSVYDMAQLFASTTRGEGFGLTIAEAILRNKRVLVPEFGGHTDFVHDNNYFVKSRLENIKCTNLSRNYYPYMKLVEADFEDTKKKLRMAYNDYKSEKYNWTGKQNESVKFTKKYLSETKVLAKLKEILGE